MTNQQNIDPMDIQAITTSLECQIVMCETALKTYLFGSDSDRDEDILHGLRYVLERLKEQAAEANRELDALYMSMSR